MNFNRKSVTCHHRTTIHIDDAATDADFYAHVRSLNSKPGFSTVEFGHKDFYGSNPYISIIGPTETLIDSFLEAIANLRGQSDA